MNVYELRLLCSGAEQESGAAAINPQLIQAALERPYGLNVTNLTLALGY